FVSIKILHLQNPIATVGIVPWIGCLRNLLRVTLPERHREGKGAVAPPRATPMTAHGHGFRRLGHVRHKPLRNLSRSLTQPLNHAPRRRASRVAAMSSPYHCPLRLSVRFSVS